jgi:hypothetical protein
MFLAGAMVMLPMLMALLASDNVILENRLYLAVVGVSVLVGELLRTVLAQRGRWPAPAWATLGGVSLLMAIATLRQTGQYRDCEAFGRAAMAASPSSWLAKWLYGAHADTAKKTNDLASTEQMVGYGSVFIPLSQFRAMQRLPGARSSASR